MAIVRMRRRQLSKRDLHYFGVRPEDFSCDNVYNGLFILKTPSWISVCYNWHVEHIRNIAAAVLVGFILAGVMGQFVSSKLPPCDLVAKGIGISIYGCSNNIPSTYPCKDEPANSKIMADCIQQNYYREKTFPFGFKQHFGPNSNLLDSRPLNENSIASFVLGFALTIVSLYVFQTIKRKPSQTAE